MPRMQRKTSEEREIVPGMAEAIHARRRQLRIEDVAELVRRTGLTRQGLAPLLAGVRKGYQERTTGPVCRVLRWKPDGIDRLMRGEAPIERDPTTADLDEEISRLAEQTARLAQSHRDTLSVLRDVAELAGVDVSRLRFGDDADPPPPHAAGQ